MLEPSLVNGRLPIWCAKGIRFKTALEDSQTWHPQVLGRCVHGLKEQLEELPQKVSWGHFCCNLRDVSEQGR